MKKKLAMMCIAGVLAVGMCACGSKSEEITVGTEAEQSTTESASTEATTEEAASEETKVSERADYVALEDLEVKEYVTLADYKGITVQANRTKVTDELIEEYINANILTTYSVTDRAVADGDLVTIDYEGKKDGVAFEGGTAQGYQLKIGSGTFIPGFEEGLVGVMPGDTVDLNLTFPQTYSNNPDLAGAAVVFTVTVQNILESTDYDNVSVEQMKQMNLSYASKDELWKDGKEQLEQEVEENYQTNISNAIMEQLVNNCTFTSIPQPLVDEEVQNYNEYMEAICVSFYGCDLETFVTSYYQMTMEQYNKQMEEMAQETVKQYLILEAVAREEGIEISNESITKKAEEESAQYGYESAQALLDEVGKTTYRMYMLQEQVMDKLKTMVTVETVAAEEAETEAETETEEETQTETAAE